jgi:hypothetical protein
VSKWKGERIVYEKPLLNQGFETKSVIFSTIIAHVLPR